jgi:polysaccharide deacetylase 2 family uncharacterized protein YibQ
MKFPELKVPLAVVRVLDPVMSRVRALPRRAVITLGVTVLVALLFLAVSMLPAAQPPVAEEKAVVRLPIGAWPKQETGLLDSKTEGRGQQEPGDALIANNGAVISDPALIEITSEGPLPRISDDGRMPMSVYSRRTDTTEIRPRIAIVVTGLGISPSTTTATLDGLPAGVTLAFSPYGSDLQGFVSLARGKGNEVVLEVPMEPYDFPNTDPGQNTLLAGASANVNGARLRWILTRFTGYAGLVSMEGSKFMSSAADMRLLLDASRRRGLFFVDGGVSDQSVARETAAAVGGHFARVDVRIDTNPSQEMMAQSLGALEKVATQKGSAIGVTGTYPSTAAQIGAWANALEQKGFALVPLSALLDKPVPQLAQTQVEAVQRVETRVPEPKPPAPEAVRSRPQPKPPALRRSTDNDLSSKEAVKPFDAPKVSKPGPHP